VKVAYVVIFITGLACGLALVPLFESITHPDTTGVDPSHVGLTWGWLAFGYAGQALFTGRMLVQWIATEKRKQSVVPTLFWWLSLFGGLILLIYFVRRGDPVGILGQIFGSVVYARNLILIQRVTAAQAD
jgi:lipid-A-disaccharide synthase-like uncharacterized protein